MTTVLAAVILLGVLIFVHELGHFLFAKLMGVKVEKFSLGFGPRLAGFRWGETDYQISAVPLGGYVKMLGESITGDEEEPPPELTEEEKRRAYSHQPVWKRALILFSGPAFNIVFASVVYYVVFVTGFPLPNPDIGRVPEGSPAAEAGLRMRDRVLSVDGEPVESFYDLMEVITESPEGPLVLRVRRDGEELDITVTPERRTWKTVLGDEREGGDIGIGPVPFLSAVVGQVLRGSPAERAGLRSGDRIVDIEGTPIESWADMAAIVHKNPEVPLDFTVSRGGTTFREEIVPERKVIAEGTEGEEEIGLIGIRPRGNDYTKRLNLLEAARAAIAKTIEVSGLILVVLVKLVQRVIPADTLGGPILILQMAGQEASKGLVDYLFLLAGISVNLGVFNLFPIPVLDGGHLFFLGIEAVRRKPLSERTMLLAQKVGLALLVTLIAFVFYNDIIRIITGKSLPW